MENPQIILSGFDLYSKIETLRQIKVDPVNWEVFYLDEVSGQKWVKQHPHSEMQGGGAPVIKLLSKFPWE